MKITSVESRSDFVDCLTAWRRAICDASEQGLLKEGVFLVAHNGQEKAIKVLGRLPNNKRWTINESHYQQMCVYHNNKIPVYVISYIDDDNTIMEERRFNPHFAGPLQKDSQNPNQWYRMYGFLQS